MRSSATTTILALASWGLACGGPSHPRISVIETTTANSSGAEVEHLEMDYKDSHLRTATRRVGSDITEVLEFDYKDDRVSRVEKRVPNHSDYSHNTTLTYRDGNVRRIETVETTNNITFTYTTEFAYDDDRMSKITWTRHSPNETESSQTKIEYENERLKKVSEYRGASVEISEFEYDEDHLLESITVTAGTRSQLVLFQYNEDGHLKEVAERGTTWEITFQGGWIDELKASLPGGTSTRISYDYEDGDVDGITPVPNLPWGQLFDMKGRYIKEFNHLTSDWLDI